jgi:hypothetical protein
MAKSAKEMVNTLREALATGAGVVSVTIDGQTTTFDRKQTIDELKYWKSEAIEEAGKRRLFIPIKLG